MKIGVQLTVDGLRFEFELLPDDDLWCLNPVNRCPVNRCNEAGLIATFQLVRQTAERTAREREREIRRCRLATTRQPTSRIARSAARCWQKTCVAQWVLY